VRECGEKATTLNLISYTYQQTYYGTKNIFNHHILYIENHIAD